MGKGMTNHPNRSRRANPAANPTPDEIRAARSRAGLTQREAAALIYATQSAWEDWEQGRRRMHPGLFELFSIKTGQARGRTHWRALSSFQCAQ